MNRFLIATPQWMNKKIKRLLVTLAVLIGAHVTLVITENTHLYPTLQHTVFKGKIGPDIDEFPIFENREVKPGTHTPWAENFTNKKLNAEELKLHEDLKSVAFLVIKNQEIKFEQYWEGYSAESLSNSFSMAKSFVSIAIGCAIQDGHIKSIDQPISDFIPQFNGGKNVSIKNLLTMSSGINFDEHYINPFAYPARANYGNNLEKLTYKYAQTTEPGKIFKYKSGNTQLLAFIVKKATGKTLSQYFSERVWSKIGAKNSALWSMDYKNGDEKAFCCFNSNVRDFARIGQLYLNGGNWANEQIVPEWYVSESTKAAQLNESDNNPCKRYGYQWWLTQYNGKSVYYARGILGQYIIAIPSDNLLVVRLGHKRIKPKKFDPPAELHKYIESAYRLSE